MKYVNCLKTVSSLALLVSLSGCASLQTMFAEVGKAEAVTTPAQMSQAVYVFDEPVNVQEIAQPTEIPNYIMPGQMKLKPMHANFTRQPYISPFQAVSAANKSAAIEPDASNYLNAIQVYPYTPGSLYQVYAAPQQVTDIALERGEGLTSVSAGDTIRWIVGDTVSGEGTNEQVHVLVKPTAAKLATNLVITTTKRTYYLEFHSFKDIYMAAVSWRYPRNLVRKTRKTSRKVSKASFKEAKFTPKLENLHFDYVIKGDTPMWRPVRVFDDGRKVFIQFPDVLGRSEAPPLFITGKKGASKHKGQLVNYRVKGNYYVVDRLFDAAELRLGEKNQTVVRIEREARKPKGQRS